MPLRREPEQSKAEVPAPPAWEATPWTPEERVAAQPEAREEPAVRLADQNQHVVELPKN